MHLAEFREIAFVVFAEVDQRAEHLQIGDQSIHFGQLFQITVVVAGLRLPHQVLLGTQDVQLVGDIDTELGDVGVVFLGGLRLGPAGELERISQG